MEILLGTFCRFDHKASAFVAPRKQSIQNDIINIVDINMQVTLCLEVHLFGRIKTRISDSDHLQLSNFLPVICCADTL